MTLDTQMNRYNNIDSEIKGNFLDNWFFISNKLVANALDFAGIEYGMIGGTSVQMYILDQVMKDKGYTDLNEITVDDINHGVLRPTDDMDLVSYRDENYNKRIQRTKEYINENNMEEFGENLYLFEIEREDGTNRFYITSESDKGHTKKLKISVISDNPLKENILNKKQKITLVKNNITTSIYNGPIENTMIGKYIRMNKDRDVSDFYNVMRYCDNFNYKEFLQNFVDVTQIKYSNMNKHFKKKQKRIKNMKHMIHKDGGSLLTPKEFYDTIIYDIYVNLNKKGQTFTQFMDTLKHPKF